MAWSQAAARTPPARASMASGLASPRPCRPEDWSLSKMPIHASPQAQIDRRRLVERFLSLAEARPDRNPRRSDVGPILLSSQTFWRRLLASKIAPPADG